MTVQPAGIKSAGSTNANKRIVNESFGLVALIVGRLECKEGVSCAVLPSLVDGISCKLVPVSRDTSIDSPGATITRTSIKFVLRT